MSNGSRVTWCIKMHRRGVMTWTSRMVKSKWAKSFFGEMASNLSWILVCVWGRLWHHQSCWLKDLIVFKFKGKCVHLSNIATSKLMPSLWQINFKKILRASLERFDWLGGIILAIIVHGKTPLIDNEPLKKQFSLGRKMVMKGKTKGVINGR